MKDMAYFLQLLQLNTILDVNTVSHGIYLGCQFMRKGNV
jgi:hypothetical protein